MVHDDDRGDVQIDSGVIINDDTLVVDDVSAEELEQVLFDHPAMSQLIRTTREYQLIGLRNCSSSSIKLT